MSPHDASELRRELQRGKNIVQLVRERDGDPLAPILYSYDAQSGLYIEKLNDPVYRAHKNRFVEKLAGVLDRFTFTTILDAGVGEATTFAPLLARLRHSVKAAAIDISLSRLLYARSYLTRHGKGDTQLAVAALDKLPFADRSIDLVLTTHAVEPNGGRESVVLAELLRVARNHLVMVEPSYELGSTESRARMERLGYVKDLPGALARHGTPAASVEKWGIDDNPENEAALIVVDRPSCDESASGVSFVSPISYAPLERRQDCLFCPGDGHAFPIISGIPCLLQQNAVLASHLTQF